MVGKNQAFLSDNSRVGTLVLSRGDSCTIPWSFHTSLTCYTHSVHFDILKVLVHILLFAVQLQGSLTVSKDCFLADYAAEINLG